MQGIAEASPVGALNALDIECLTQHHQAQDRDADEAYINSPQYIALDFHLSFGRWWSSQSKRRAAASILSVRKVRRLWQVRFVCCGTSLRSFQFCIRIVVLSILCWPG